MYMEPVNKKFHLSSSPQGIFFSGILILIFLTATVLGGCSKSSISIQQPADDKALGECVVLLHGMGRTLRSMAGMQKQLRAEGYHTVNLDYPSTSKTIEEIATAYFPKSIDQCQQFKPSAIHFVSHSLGGIILRSVFTRRLPENMGRVVMLSPPNKGSEVADFFKEWWFYETLNGPAGQQLTTDENSVPNQLGPVDYPVGIMTGDRFYFFDFWFSSVIPGIDDGKVSVQNARLEGMRDFRVVHETHPFIMNSKYVQEETIYFLKNGVFKNQQNVLSSFKASDWFSFSSK